MIWINGIHQTWMSATDRAVQFGDGCFTTARIRKGKVVWLNAHIQRLQRDSRRLLLEDNDWMALRTEMITAAAGHKEGVVKVILTRGSGGRGYSIAECGSPTRILFCTDYPAHYLTLRDQGVRLNISPIRLSRNTLLAGIKHLNRLEQIMISTQLQRTGYDETLVLDTDHNLVECCAANIFWRIGERVFTPLLTHAGVEGIMRQRIMLLLEQYGCECQQVSAETDVLACADEVLICNALMPILSVKQLVHRHYGSRLLSDWLRPLCE